MKLFEYQSKKWLSGYGVTVPRGAIVDEKSCPKFPVMLKAQVLTGHRGLNGGVIRVETPDEFTRTIEKLRDLTIDGQSTSTILAEEIIPFDREFYLSLRIDREHGEIRLLFGRGGVHVESSSKKTLVDLPLDDVKSVVEKLSKEIVNPHELKLTRQLIEKLSRFMIEKDALLVEINPLVFANGTAIALDAKIEIDDNALFRHPEFGASTRSHNFVELDSNGNVAVVANGAGLAMATVDDVNASGLRAVNFLDIGGGADTDAIIEQFRKFSAYPKLRAIIVNVFAGITRCDQVASALIAANDEIDNLPPLLVRLHGTNLDEARQILDAAKIPLLSDLKTCVARAKELVL